MQSPTIIPADVRKKALKCFKGFFGQTNQIPDAAIPVVTVATGACKAGTKGWIIGGGDRTVFVGTEPKLIETKVAEFTILLESGCQFLGQMGRDFVFA